MGGSFLLCNIIMLIMKMTNKDLSYRGVYPLLSVIAAFTTVALVIPTIMVSKEVPSV